MKLILILLLNMTPIQDTTQCSWYGEPFHGRITANGETYHMDSLTAANVHLPFNTLVEITNLDNNKSVVVRINDRGAYKMDSKGKVLYPLTVHPTRKFDLSRAAFSQIANLDQGIINIIYRIK